ncbi:MAG: PAS domain S-box protein [Anaerolineales bacterium]
MSEHTEHEGRFPLINSRFFVLYSVGILLVIGGFIGAAFLIDRQAVQHQEAMFNEQQALQTFLAKQAMHDHIDDLIGDARLIAEATLPAFEIGAQSQAEATERLQLTHEARTPEILAYLYMPAPDEIALAQTTPSSKGEQAKHLAETWAAEHWPAIRQATTDAPFVPPFHVTQELQAFGMFFPVRVEGARRGTLVLVGDFAPMVERYIRYMRSGQYGAAYLQDGRGVVVYDHETEIIGENVFETLHIAYPELLAIDHRMQREAKGTAAYNFTVDRHQANLVRRKLLAWDTVSIGEQDLVVALSAPNTEIDAILLELRTQRILLGITLSLFIAGMSVLLFRWRQSVLTRAATTLRKQVSARTAELAASEARYRQLVDNAPLGIIYVRSDGAITAVNPALAEILGAPSTAAIQQINLFESESIQAAGLLSPIQQALQQDETAIIEHPYTSSWGKSAHLRIHIAPQFDEQGENIGGQALVEDVSALKAAQDSLRESEERFRTIADFTYDWEYWLGPDHRPRYVSPSCERVTGYSLQAFMEDPDLIHKIIHPEDQAKFRIHHQTSLETSGETLTLDEEMPRNTSLDIRIITREGRERWIHHICQPIYNAAGTYMGIRASNRDITERKKMERALRETGQRYRALFNRMQDAIFIFEPEGRILTTNHQAANLLGYHQETLMGTPFQDFVIPQEQDKHQRQVAALLTGDVLPIYETRLRSSAGKTIPVEISAVLVQEPEEVNGARYIQSIARDITQRKEAELALHHYAERLKMLHEIDQAIISAQSPEKIARAALKRIQQLMPCNWASVIEFNPDTDTVKVLATRGDHQTKLNTGYLTPLESFVQADLITPSSTLFHDLSAHPNLSPIQRMLYMEGVRTLLNVPLHVQDRFTGALLLGADHANAFSADHTDIAAEVAASLAITIQQARLHEQTQQDAATKAALLQEVNHRVKNNLTAIIGLLLAEQRYTPSDGLIYVEAITERLTHRIQGMVTVHEMLSASEWRPLPLSDLVTEVTHTTLRALESHNISVDVTSHPGKTIKKTMKKTMKADHKQASSLALILHELVSNTIKHAIHPADAAPHTAQRTHITIEITSDPDDHSITLIYRDNGPGYPADVLQMQRYDVGLYLIQRLVKKNLRGTLVLSNDTDTHNGGAVTEIHFPSYTRNRSNILSMRNHL